MATRATPASSAASVEDAANAVVDAHKAIIQAVTPKHENCLLGPDKREEMDAAWSRWHSTCRALRDALGRRGEYA